jgi:hypothetical protein
VGVVPELQILKKKTELSWPRLGLADQVVHSVTAEFVVMQAEDKVFLYKSRKLQSKLLFF